MTPPNTDAKMLRVIRAMDILKEHPDLKIEITESGLTIDYMKVLEDAHGLEMKPMLNINMWYLVWRPSASSISMLTMWSEEVHMKVERPQA